MQKIDSTILFGNADEELNTWFLSHDYSSIHVLCDENTIRDCWSKIEGAHWPSDPSIQVIPVGELAKNLKTCETVWEGLIANSADRNSLFINLGGGVVTDLGGFCAASFMRGMNFLHIPTSVLAMTDAAIGGKHGVDFLGYKNYIGTFAEPECIIIDTQFIESLDPGEIRSGLAEVVKHGFLADRGLIEMLVNAGQPNALDWMAIMQRSVAIKLGFVNEDLRDRGVRAALNYGHTIGHAIETHQLLAGNPVRHGEAVALGMLVEAAISVAQLDMSNEDKMYIENTIKQLFPDLSFPLISTEELQKLILKDKKKSGKDVLFSLLKSIGVPVVDQIVPSSIVNESYLHYNS